MFLRNGCSDSTGNRGTKMSKANAKRSTAYHEAGHAVAHWVQGLGMHEVTIIPDKKEGTLGHVSGHKIPKHIREKFEAVYSLRAEGLARKEVIVLFAGHEAERLVSGRTSAVSWESDREMAYELMSCFSGSEQITLLWLKLLFAQAQAMVNSHKNLISSLGEHLLKCERMNGCEVREFLSKEITAG